MLLLRFLFLFHEGSAVESIGSMLAGSRGAGGAMGAGTDLIGLFANLTT